MPSARIRGGVAEWLMAPVCYAGRRAMRATQVRILPPPPRAPFVQWPGHLVVCEETTVRLPSRGARSREARSTGRGHRTRSHSFRGSSAVERLAVNQRPRRFDPCPRSFLRERGRRPPAGLIRRPCLVRLQGSRLTATAPSANGQATRFSTWRSEFDPPWSYSGYRRPGLHTAWERVWGGRLSRRGRESCSVEESPPWLVWATASQTGSAQQAGRRLGSARRTRVATATNDSLSANGARDAEMKRATLAGPATSNA
jgi:hypothetical protein